MGRFDELTKLDEQPPKKPSKKRYTALDEITDQLKNSGENELEQSAFFREAKAPSTSPSQKPEIMNSGNHEKSPSPTGLAEKPEKFSTLLHRDFKRKLKVRAAELDVKDYEVLEIALTEYFDKYK
jgi:hypothetical protein